MYGISFKKALILGVAAFTVYSFSGKALNKKANTNAFRSFKDVVERSISVKEHFPNLCAR